MFVPGRRGGFGRGSRGYGGGPDGGSQGYGGGPDGGFQGYGGGPRRGRGPGIIMPFLALIGRAHPNDPGGGVLNMPAQNEEEPKRFSLLEYLGELLLQFFS